MMTMSNNIAEKDEIFDETRFLSLFKEVGYKEFLNWSIIWAFILTILFITFVYYYGNLIKDLALIASSITTTLLGASAGILGIVIAALTLSITLFHEKLLPAMRKTKLL